MIQSGFMNDAPVLIFFPNLAPFAGRVRTAVTTRNGGVSGPPFDSLNLGFSSGDDANNVFANRRRALSAFRTGEGKDDYPLDGWASLHQVHGAAAILIDENYAGLNAFPGADNWPPPQGDAMLTNTPGIVLAISVADCVPVVLFDPERRALGAAHCGWRPAAGGILKNLVNEMRHAFGTNPKNVHAGIGPGISGANYEVGGEVARHFLGRDYEGYRVIWDSPKNAPGGAPKYQLNLWAALSAQLDSAGVPMAQVSTIVKCTYAESGLFFSYRRDGERTGRMALLAELV